MKHFKHLNHGMSLIEVVMAIAILAFFGTSIFVMQQYLFDRMMVAQKKLTASLRVQSEIVAYQKNILQEFLELKSPIEKSLQKVEKVFTYPDMTITISVKSDLAAEKQDKKSNFEKFKNLYLITAQAEETFFSDHARANAKKVLSSSFLFVYIPEVAKK